ncbi:hypothetical protein DPMN_087355 [Dreissena polymorpha]|uniref:Uncharacterized protein n=1 Tax=Dreissena polymorpha TaxID=45954 RepID=A0A9D4QWT7_DREPO|nr:hypothetical protein DPMN_087355 [Dreissena polymorpha]
MKYSKKLKRSVINAQRARAIMPGQIPQSWEADPCHRQYYCKPNLPRARSCRLKKDHYINCIVFHTDLDIKLHIFTERPYVISRVYRRLGTIRVNVGLTQMARFDRQGVSAPATTSETQWGLHRHLVQIVVYNAVVVGLKGHQAGHGCHWFSGVVQRSGVKASAFA